MRPMSGKNQARPLKVCSTCHHWSYKYKGLCSRLNQGVGKFWTCEKWSAAAAHPLPQTRRPEAPGSATR